MSVKALIFVYNADSGVWNGYMDILHKIISPKTYPCHLCDITHGTFKIREEWKAFIADYPIPLRFLHRDEWLQAYQRTDALPAIFREDEDGTIHSWIPADEMNTLALDELMERMQEAFLASQTAKPEINSKTEKQGM